MARQHIGQRTVGTLDHQPFRNIRIGGIRLVRRVAITSRVRGIAGHNRADVIGIVTIGVGNCGARCRHNADTQIAGVVLRIGIIDGEAAGG